MWYPPSCSHLKRWTWWFTSGWNRGIPWYTSFSLCFNQFDHVWQLEIWGFNCLAGLFYPRKRGAAASTLVQFGSARFQTVRCHPGGILQKSRKCTPASYCRINALLLLSFCISWLRWSTLPFAAQLDRKSDTLVSPTKFIKNLTWFSDVCQFQQLFAPCHFSSPGENLGLVPLQIQHDRSPHGERQALLMVIAAAQGNSEGKTYAIGDRCFHGERCGWVSLIKKTKSHGLSPIWNGRVLGLKSISGETR